MKYGEQIDKFMPLVKDGSDLPCIIRRNNDKWEIDYLDLPPLRIAEYLAAAKKQDPCAVLVSGKEFSGASYPTVYDTVLIKRLNAEYDAIPPDKADLKELRALVDFFEEYACELTHEVMEHIAEQKRPLVYLDAVLPISLISNDKLTAFNYDKAEQAIKMLQYRIEKNIVERENAETDDVTVERPKPTLHDKLEAAKERANKEHPNTPPGRKQEISI
jgi:hypothetical protein